MDTQDLDLTASSDGRLRCRWKGLHGSVVGEHDRAMAALADAHDDPRLSADQIAKRRRLAAFNPPQCGEDREGHSGAECAERERQRGPAGGAETERPGRRGPKRNATAPKSPPMPNIARKPSSTGIPVASSVRVARRKGTRTCGIRNGDGRWRRTCMPPPMLERRSSAVPSTAEPVKTSSSASALIVIASFPEELLPSRSYRGSRV